MIRKKIIIAIDDDEDDEDDEDDIQYFVWSGKYKKKNIL